jgi:hypothetical protein
MYSCSGLEELAIVCFWPQWCSCRATHRVIWLNRVSRLLPLWSDGNIPIVPVRQGNVLKRCSVAAMITNNSPLHPQHPRVLQIQTCSWIRQKGTSLACISSGVPRVWSDVTRQSVDRAGPTLMKVMHTFWHQNSCILMISTLLRNTVFWDDTRCGSCKNRHFGGT